MSSEYYVILEFYKKHHEQSNRNFKRENVEVKPDQNWNWEDVAKALPCKPPKTNFPPKGRKRSKAILAFCKQATQTAIQEIPDRDEKRFKSVAHLESPPASLEWSLQLMKNSGIQFECHHNDILIGPEQRKCAGIYQRQMCRPEILGFKIFIPSMDHEYIKLLHPDRMFDFNDMFQTVFHEMAHWTAHENRLNRNFMPDQEELLADMAALCLLELASFEEETRQNWILDLKQTCEKYRLNPLELRDMIPDIAKAVEFILNPAAFPVWTILPPWMPRLSIKKSRKTDFMERMNQIDQNGYTTS